MKWKIEVATQVSPLNVRYGPGTSYNIAKTLPKGSIRIVIDSANDGTWFKLDAGEGWVAATYCKLLQNLEQTSPAQSSPAASTTQTVAKSYTQVADAIKGVVDNYNNYNNTLKGTTGHGSGVTYYEPISSDIQNKSGFPPQVGTDSNGCKIYDYYMDTDYQRTNMQKIRRNLNILIDDNNGYKSLIIDLFSKFNRFKIEHPDMHLTKSFSYVFFTRPDLNIMETVGGGNWQLTSQVANDPVFYYLSKNNKNLLASLTSAYSPNHDFHPFLSNMAESFELSDEYIKTMEHGETFTGFKVQYGKNNIESKTAGTFSVKYTDDSEFSVYKTHKAWIDYISKVYRGELETKREYKLKKVLDYACSVYYIICGADGETILFWSKYYGVFPTNAPSSTQSWSKGNMVKMPDYNINYAYSYKEDFSPLSLAEFNMNSRGNFTYRKIYEPGLLSTGRSMVGAPFIETTTDSATGGYIFKLKFRNG